MYYVYVLESIESKKKYVGSSADVEKRLKEHNVGKVRSTKAYKPYELVYTESFETKTEARRRENFLKSGVGRQVLIGLLEE